MPSTVPAPAAAKRLRTIKSRLAQLRASAARTLWEYGALFAEVERDELWRHDGATSFGVWVETVADTSRRTARRAIALSRQFTAEMAERFGSEKLIAGLRYLEATGKDEKPGDLLALDLRLRGEGGTFISVPFTKATVRQVRDATALVERAHRAARKAIPVAAVDPATAERGRALAAALPESGTKPEDRVRFQTRADGKLAVSFADIPVDALDDFLVLVKQHLKPA